ncbi:hypothetical protein BC628DRAFT_827622 [Trametes gibbosa]|nr:hypothetical protein BC628DRAFT_827622 [Trametes gibbosa]
MYPPYWHWGRMYRCGRTTSRLVWFGLGAFVATWYHAHHGLRSWHESHCSRYRIPQQAYPPPSTSAPADGSPPQDADAIQAQPGQGDRKHGWGWGGWGREHQHEGGRPGWGQWGRDAQREGMWGAPPPPPPMPIPGEKGYPNEKDIVQQATDTITDLSEATLNNLLVTVESLKAKLAEHRAQREQQERELQALREAKFKQFEEWQRQLEAQQAAKAKAAGSEPPRRLV